MSILTLHLMQTLRLFVQAEDNYGVFDFLSLKEALTVSETVIKQLLSPETILLDNEQEAVVVETGVKYKRKSHKHYWADIENTVEQAIAIHFPRNAEKPIEEIQSPFPIVVTRFMNLIISPLITEFTKMKPSDVFTMINSNENVFASINKYIDEVEVSPHRDNIAIAQATLSKRALSYKNPRKKKEYYKRKRKNEAQRSIE